MSASSDSIDAHVLAENLKCAIEDAMANADSIAEAVDILNMHIDHPELDKVIAWLESIYHNNQRAWEMCRSLSNSVRGQGLRVRRSDRWGRKEAA